METEKTLSVFKFFCVHSELDMSSESPQIYLLKESASFGRLIQTRSFG